jgi:hypothetical protein
MNDDDIEDLYRTDWVALALATVISLVSLAALAFVLGYLT